MSLQSSRARTVAERTAGSIQAGPTDRQTPDLEIPDLEIDVTADMCPMTFVRTRLALDRLASGQILAVRLRGEEAARNVPRTSAEQGHAVLAQTIGNDGVTRLLLRRK